jgi:hypothetical protein
MAVVTKRIRRFFREIRAELRGRRAGRAGYEARSSQRSVRHIVGPTGNMFSNGWKRMEEGAEAYQRSLEPRIPPSIHISHRDATRHNVPVPLQERMIEDWQNPVPYPDPYEGLDLTSGRRSTTQDREG